MPEPAEQIHLEELDEAVTEEKYYDVKVVLTEDDLAALGVAFGLSEIVIGELLNKFVEWLPQARMMKSGELVQAFDLSGIFKLLLEKLGPLALQYLGPFLLEKLGPLFVEKILPYLVQLLTDWLNKSLPR